MEMRRALGCTVLFCLLCLSSSGNSFFKPLERRGNCAHDQIEPFKLLRKSNNRVCCKAEDVEDDDVDEESYYDTHTFVYEDAPKPGRRFLVASVSVPSPRLHAILSGAFRIEEMCSPARVLQIERVDLVAAVRILWRTCMVR